MAKIKQAGQRLLAMLAAVLMMLPAFLTGVPDVSAATTGTISTSWIPGYYFDFSGLGLDCGSFQGQASMLAVNGEPAYCIELGTHASAGSGSLSEVYSKFTTEQKNLIQYTLIYGYRGKTQYGYSKNVEYYATQILCWIIQNGYYNNSSMSSRITEAAMSSNPDKADIRACISKMREGIDSHEKRPSFMSASSSSAKEYKLKPDGSGKYSVILTDTNNVASYFQWGTANGVTATVSGNKVTFTASSAFNDVKSFGTQKIKSKYISKIDEVSPMYLSSSSNQDMVCDLGGRTDPVRAYMKLSIDSGDLKIEKASEDGTLSGFQFRVTGNGIDRTITTNASGTATLNDIPAGKYTVTEVSVPDRYAEPDAQSVTVVSGQTVTVKFHNQLKKVRVQAAKQDAETATAQGDASLSGAVYGLYDASGNLLGEYTTDGDGSFTTEYFTCEAGMYLQEITPPAGYLKNDTKYTLSTGADQFTVEYNTVEQTVKDSVIKGRVMIMLIGVKL